MSHRTQHVSSATTCSHDAQGTHVTPHAARRTANACSTAPQAPRAATAHTACSAPNVARSTPPKPAPHAATLATKQRQNQATSLPPRTLIASATSSTSARMTAPQVGKAALSDANARALVTSVVFCDRVIKSSPIIKPISQSIKSINQDPLSSSSEPELVLANVTATLPYALLTCDRMVRPWMRRQAAG